jgi:enoyl-CoA hydratase/carnithine racemase
LAKRAIDLGGDRSLPEALQLEWECYLETLDTEDRLEALRAFGEKRTPKFEGR